MITALASKESKLDKYFSALSNLVFLCVIVVTSSFSNDEVPRKVISVSLIHENERVVPFGISMLALCSSTDPIRFIFKRGAPFLLFFGSTRCSFRNIYDLSVFSSIM